MKNQVQRRTLRQEMQKQRLALTPMQRLASAQGICAQLQALPEFLTDEHVAGYWAVRGEIPLHAVQAHLAHHAQHYYLPLIHSDAQYPLRFGRWHVGEDLQANDFGIPEPTTPSVVLNPLQLQLVLVPLLAFDREGNRLGSGQGYYDRAFSALNHGERPREPVLVGVGYAFQEVAQLKAQSWDVPLDFIVTEKELITCTPGGQSIV